MLLTVSFALFTVCSPIGYYVLTRVYEPEPEPAPVVDAGVDAGPPDAGPPAPEVITYRGTLAQSTTATYGGRPYCRYQVSFTDLELVVTTVGVDAQNRPLPTGGQVGATYAEQTIEHCPHQPIPQNTHELAFAGADYEGDVVVIRFDARSGDPIVAATLRGTFRDGALEGTLAIRRIDQRDEKLVFAVEAVMRLARAEE